MITSILEIYYVVVGSISSSKFVFSFTLGILYEKLSVLNSAFPIMGTRCYEIIIVVDASVI